METVLDDIEFEFWIRSAEWCPKTEAQWQREFVVAEHQGTLFVQTAGNKSRRVIGEIPRNVHASISDYVRAGIELEAYVMNSLPDHNAVLINIMISSEDLEEYKEAINNIRKMDRERKREQAQRAQAEIRERAHKRREKSEARKRVLERGCARVINFCVVVATFTAGLVASIPGTCVSRWKRLVEWTNKEV